MEMKGDHILMRNGSVIVMRDGEEMPLEEEITLADGTKVMPNGQVLVVNGTTRMMREGETITVDRETPDAEAMTDRQFKEAMEDEELRDQLH